MIQKANIEELTGSSRWNGEKAVLSDGTSSPRMVFVIGAVSVYLEKILRDALHEHYTSESIGVWGWWWKRDL